MKYKLTNEVMEWQGRTLHRIECVEPFDIVKSGEKGGWIEKEENLSQIGFCWVSKNAWVYGNARVYGDAYVYGEAVVYGEARVYGDARVYGVARVYGDADVCDNAWVHGDACVHGKARVHGDAKIESIKDYIVFKNNWSSGRYFTWTRSNDMWLVGCFYGTGEELIKKAYQDSKNSGRHYEAYVKFVKQLKQLSNENRTY